MWTFLKVKIAHGLKWYGAVGDVDLDEDKEGKEALLYTFAIEEDRRRPSWTFEGWNCFGAQSQDFWCEKGMGDKKGRSLTCSAANGKAADQG